MNAEENNSSRGQKVEVRFSESELAIIVAALNEICHGIHIDDFEFHARVGAEREEARALLDRLLPTLNGMEKSD